jgi:hypothetical protein
VARPDLRTLYGQRLSFEDYLNRKQGKPIAADTAPPVKTVRDPLDKTAGALASATEIGDMFEIAIDEPITLARQKSALIPIIDKEITGTRVSIYNPTVLVKHPMLGLQLKNSTSLHLSQGPVAVYDAGVFAGDARLPDIKPIESRLLSYAIDLGTEVVPITKPKVGTLEVVKVVPGLIEAKTKWKWETKYTIRNRDTRDRMVLVEHPRVTGLKLITPAKPAELTRNFTRFEVPVKVGQSETLDIVEESESNESLSLTSADSNTLLYFSKHEATKPEVRKVLARMLELRSKVEDAKAGIAAEQEALKEIAEDQDRMRKNIERAPKESDAYKRYVKKFDEQETEIEKRQAKLKSLRIELAKHELALKEYAASAKAE